jgi:HTH-type transcriptional regulator/antitoxin HigA
MAATIKQMVTTKVADDYLKLVRQFPLRPLRSKHDYDAAIGVLKALVARADDGLSPGETDYADALSQFVGSYESAHYAIPHQLRTPLERLKYLMQQHAMKSGDLGKLLGSGPGHASLILNGKRELSKANIRTLADRFKVSAALFF